MGREIEYANATVTALKTRGWTDAGVRRFLDPPDATRCNPRFRGAAPMHLYAVERVARVEASPEWQEWRRASRLRSSAVKAAQAPRRAAREAMAGGHAAALMELVTATPISVPRWSWGEVCRRAVQHYNERNPLSPVTMAAARSAGEAPLSRWCVNYLRHVHTPYDVVMDQLRGLPPCSGRSASPVRSQPSTPASEKRPLISDTVRRKWPTASKLRLLRMRSRARNTRPPCRRRSRLPQRQSTSRLTSAGAGQAPPDHACSEPSGGGRGTVGPHSDRHEETPARAHEGASSCGHRFGMSAPCCRLRLGCQKMSQRVVVSPERRVSRRCCNCLVAWVSPVSARLMNEPRVWRSRMAIRTGSPSQARGS